MLIFETSYYSYRLLWSLIVSIVFFIFFIKIIANKKFEVTLKNYYKNKFNKPFFAIIFFGLALGFFVGSEPFSYWKAQKALKEKKFLTVSGQIENYIPKSKCSSHEIESFIVQGVKFEYSNHDNSSAYYKKTKCDGNKFKNNQKIKINYISENGKNKIIKMWGYSGNDANSTLPKAPTR